MRRFSHITIIPMHDATMDRVFLSVLINIKHGTRCCLAQGRDGVHHDGPLSPRWILAIKVIQAHLSG